MNELRTSRVVVIDDDKDEAIPLLAVLNRLGIGVLYYDGNKENLPKKPITGIRLIFLDLRLMGSPTSQPKHYIAQTLSILEQIVDCNNDLAGIVYWTKHDEDKAEFEAQLLQKMPQFRPSFLLAIANKMSFCNSDNSHNLEKKIQKELLRLPAQRLLWSWEQSVHDAASGTCEQLASVALKELPGEGDKTVDDEILKLLRSLVVSAGGSPDLKPQRIMNCLFESLSHIHLDQLEHYIFDIPMERLPCKKSLSEKLAQKPVLSADQTSYLNSILLISKVPPRKSYTWPGNIYIAKFWNKKEQPFPFDKRKKIFRNFISEIWANLESDARRLDFLKRQSIPCLVDITPTCDYANKKIKHVRLLGGVIIKSSGDKNRDRKLRLKQECKVFAKEIEFCRFHNGRIGLQGNYRIVINARHLYSKPVEDLRLHKAAFRLRRQVVTDIQAWFASHAARPGYLGVR